MRCITLLFITISLVPSVLAAESRVADKSTDNKEQKPRTGSAERFVMPVQTWLEEKAHSSPVLNPVHPKTKRIGASRVGLREAIKAALSLHPGTVLSASKSRAEDQSVIYKIKILSDVGVIKQIDIPLKSLDTGSAK